jgi:hypothetical protein
MEDIHFGPEVALAQDASIALLDIAGAPWGIKWCSAISRRCTFIPRAHLGWLIQSGQRMVPAFIAANSSSRLALVG